MRTEFRPCHIASLLAATVALAGGSASTVGPGVRNAHAMVYDERREAVVLFGGASATAVLDDTWTWDASAWRPLTVRGPSPRTFPAAAWDAARGEVVLFGGRSVLFGREGDRDRCLSDTWVLRHDGWYRRAIAGPAARSEAGMAFDRARRVTVLFGGYSDAGAERTMLGDTWEWDGAAWTLRGRTGPAPRSGIAMAYDERLRRVVLFGGNRGPRSDTWTWDGHQWDEVRTPPTPGRFNSIAQYDPVRERVVRTTGWNGAERVRETWLFDGARWLLKSSDGPPPRNHSAAAFDRRRQRLVLYGGHEGTLVFGDTWEWDGTRWTERVSVAPRPRIENGH